MTGDRRRCRCVGMHTNTHVELQRYDIRIKRGEEDLTSGISSLIRVPGVFQADGPPIWLQIGSSLN